MKVDPWYWRARADLCFLLAQATTEPRARQAHFAMGVSYMRLITLARRRYERSAGYRMDHGVTGWIVRRAMVFLRALAWTAAALAAFGVLWVIAIYGARMEHPYVS